MNKLSALIPPLLACWALGTASRAHLDLGDLLPAAVEWTLVCVGVAAALVSSWRPGIASKSPDPVVRGHRIWSIAMVLATTAWTWQDGRAIPLAALVVAIFAVGSILANSPRGFLAARGALGWLVAISLLSELVDRVALWRLPTEHLANLLAASLGALGLETGSTGQGFLFESVRADRPTLITPELLGLPVLLLGALWLLLPWAGNSVVKSGPNLVWRIASASAYFALALLVRILLLVLVATYLDGQMDYTDDNVDVRAWISWKLTAALDGLALALAGVTWAPWRGQAGRSVSAPANLPALRWLAVSALGGVLAAAMPIADSMGTERPVRLVIDESHSDWEPTDLALGTDVYGEESGYNFRALVDWLEGRHGPVRRNYETLDSEVLEGCDVLVVKTPTEAYTDVEIGTILEFVERGGGLLLIGDHTNVFGTGDVLNAFGERLGFRLDFDCVFDHRKTFEHVFQRPASLRSHPILAQVPMIRFEVGCSIDLNHLGWTPVIVGRGLKNLQIDYKASNFYPAVRDESDMRFGQLCEMATRAYGRGRVALISDSTLFSTFSVMLPGRRELIEASLDWLGRDEIGENSRYGAVAVGLLLVVVACCVALRQGVGATTPILVVAIGSWHAARGCAERVVHTPSAPIYKLQHEANVAFLSSSERAIWPIEEFVRDYDRSYSMFFQWVLRVEGFPRLEASLEAALGSSNIVACLDPAQLHSWELDMLFEHVNAGAVLFAIESAPNASIEAIAKRIGAELSPETVACRTVATRYGAIDLGGRLECARAVMGGTSVINAETEAGNRSLLSLFEFGEGIVVLGTHGALITDSAYGQRYHAQPDGNRRRLFELQFDLFRAALAHVRSSSSAP